MTIQQAHTSLAGELGRLYDEREARTITQMVMEYLTGLSRTDQLVRKMEVLTASQEASFTKMRTQLLASMPVQYVLGEAWFAGMRFLVNEFTLIPRPETEELVQWMVDTVRENAIQPGRLLDIGTGSGCIPITLAKQLPGWEISAIDISAGAIETAKENARILDARVAFSSMDILDTASQLQLPSYSIIVSNPPYVPLEEKNSMAKHVLDYEPHTALFVPDSDPLLFYRAIAAMALQKLEPGGWLFFEISDAQGLAVVSLLEHMQFRVECRKDLMGRDRMIRAAL
ncbi:MAG: peptide chain release factor N(5)-glutamine methyltransferase [Chitinophagaceae bacterium]|nr:peptide chain release factor N(5)-glutamine methyltransferase [Chitinophagaceae bacterium]